MRDKSQSMGLWLNESILLSPGKQEAAVRDIVRSGYGIIRTMLRNTNFNHRSPVVVESMARIVSVAHAEGAKVVLDCEPHGEPVAHDMGNLFPDAIGVRIVRAEAAVVHGKFVLHIRLPRTVGTRADYLGLEAVWLEADGEVRKIEDLEFQHRIVAEPYATGFTRATHPFVEGRPVVLEHYAHISGRLPSSVNGRLVVYARFFDARVVDFWSRGFNQYYSQLLECYGGIPLDGVGWDEPGTGGRWSDYIWGGGMAAAFERLNGYRLADRWRLLDGGGLDAESVRVRLDYYRTFNEGIFEAQRHLFARARELFGEDLLLGTHHTWQGEGGINDYRSGAVDYFRLNDSMEAGYTDCWWWDAKSVSYAYTLGSSLGRLTPSGEAEVNAWDMKPTNSLTEYQARLMTLLDLIWFNIWYGESTDTCLYPADYTWPAAVREMKRHLGNVRRIDKARPVIEVAMLHGWETVCGINRGGIAAAHKTFCLNTANVFLERNVAFDWVDTRLIAGSKIEDGRLVNALGSYSVLILPYASMLPRAAWEKCVEFARAGGRLVFTGTPPERQCEGGGLSAEFATLMDMPELPLADYLATLDSAFILSESRPNLLDVCVELEGNPQRLLTSIEGERHGVRNEAGNVVYLTDLDPRERLLDVIGPWLDPGVACYSGTILWRLYRDAGRELLVCIARQDRKLEGLVRWGGEEVEFLSGTVALLERAEGKLKIFAEGADYKILGGQGAG